MLFHESRNTPPGHPLLVYPANPVDSQFRGDYIVTVPVKSGKLLMTTNSFQCPARGCKRISLSLSLSLSLSIYLSLSPSVCLFVCLSVCFSGSLSLSLSLFLFCFLVCLSFSNKKKTKATFFVSVTRWLKTTRVIRSKPGAVTILFFVNIK